MNEENNHETIPMKKSNIPVMEDSGTTNQDTVPLHPKNRLVPELTNSEYIRSDGKGDSTSSPATGGKSTVSRSLLGGALGLAVIASAAAAYSFSTRYPLPAEELLATGSDPISNLVRKQLESQEKGHASEIKRIENDWVGKLKVAKNEAELSEKRLNSEIEKLNESIRTKESPSAPIVTEVDHAPELAALQLKLNEVEKNARSTEEEQAATIDKLSAQLMSKPAIIQTTPTKVSSVKDEPSKLETKTKNENSSPKKRWSRSWVVMAKYETGENKGKWYFEAPDGFVSRLYWNRDAAINGAELRNIEN